MCVAPPYPIALSTAALHQRSQTSFSSSRRQVSPTLLVLDLPPRSTPLCPESRRLKPLLPPRAPPCRRQLGVTSSQARHRSEPTGHCGQSASSTAWALPRSTISGHPPGLPSPPWASHLPHVAHRPPRRLPQPAVRPIDADSQPPSGATRDCPIGELPSSTLPLNRVSTLSCCSRASFPAAAHRHSPEFGGPPLVPPWGASSPVLRVGPPEVAQLNSVP
jgi:hypothetical protein